VARMWRRRSSAYDAHRVTTTGHGGDHIRSGARTIRNNPRRRPSRPLLMIRAGTVQEIGGIMTIGIRPVGYVAGRLVGSGIDGQPRV
jgi:hypothetical protein